MSEITNQLSTFIAGKIIKQPGRIISPEEPLLSSGLIDSFSLMDLALFIEDTFGVRIELANPDYRIPAGLECTVVFETDGARPGH